MIKEIKKITKNNLDFLNLEENHLSIQISLDGFSFCIYNKLKDTFDAFASYQFNKKSVSPQQHIKFIEEIYQQQNLLSKKYASVNVVHINNLATQVPLPFFDKNNLSSYLKYSVKVFENDYITFDEVKNSEIVTVYIPFVNINNFLLDQYESFTFKHSSTVLIEKLLTLYKNTEGTNFFVNIHENIFEVVVLKNGKLELFNTFSFKTKEDFIYYILFTAEQLGLNPEEFQLTLLGDIEKESELYTILFQYIRNINFYKPAKFPEILSDSSAHNYFTLLNQI